MTASQSVGVTSAPSGPRNTRTASRPWSSPVGEVVRLMAPNPRPRCGGQRAGRLRARWAPLSPSTRLPVIAPPRSERDGDDRAGEVVGLGEPAQRVGRDEPVDGGVVERGRDHGGERGARSDRDDTDPVVRRARPRASP